MPIFGMKWLQWASARRAPLSIVLKDHRFGRLPGHCRRTSELGACASVPFEQMILVAGRGDVEVGDGGGHVREQRKIFVKFHVRF